MKTPAAPPPEPAPQPFDPCTTTKTTATPQTASSDDEDEDYYFKPWDPPRTTTTTPSNDRTHTQFHSKDHDHESAHDPFLTNHPLTLYITSRLTTLLLTSPIPPLHPLANTMLSHLPPDPSALALQKLRARHSYMSRAPYQQHKTRKQVIGDKVLRLCPATWLGPVILRGHERWEYRRTRREKERVHGEWVERKERREGGVGSGSGGGAGTRASSVVGLRTELKAREWSPLDEEGGGGDPWRLLPVEEMT